MGKNVACSDCKEVVGTTGTTDGGFLCRDCANKAGYRTCEDCGLLISEDYLETEEGNPICFQCAEAFAECTNCGAITGDEGTWRGDFSCKNCQP